MLVTKYILGSDYVHYFPKSMGALTVTVRKAVILLMGNVQEKASFEHAIRREKHYEPCRGRQEKQSV